MIGKQSINIILITGLCHSCTISTPPPTTGYASLYKQPLRHNEDLWTFIKALPHTYPLTHW